jgi:hypothetical protein
MLFRRFHNRGYARVEVAVAAVRRCGVFKAPIRQHAHAAGDDDRIAVATIGLPSYRERHPGAGAGGDAGGHGLGHPGRRDGSDGSPPTPAP